VTAVIVLLFNGMCYSSLHALREEVCGKSCAFDRLTEVRGGFLGRSGRYSDLAIVGGLLCFLSAIN
jgi:hypothetical protein